MVADRRDVRFEPYTNGKYSYDPFVNGFEVVQINPSFGFGRKTRSLHRRAMINNCAADGFRRRPCRVWNSVQKTVLFHTTCGQIRNTIRRFLPPSTTTDTGPSLIDRRCSYELPRRPILSVRIAFTLFLISDRERVLNTALVRLGRPVLCSPGNDFFFLPAENKNYARTIKTLACHICTGCAIDLSTDIACRSKRHLGGLFYDNFSKYYKNHILPTPGREDEFGMK